MHISAALTISVGLSLSALACIGSPTDPSRSGNLRLMITDAPFDDASALHVTFTEVKAHREDGVGGWLTVPFAGSPAATTRTCNLKKLDGPFDLLGADSLDAGQYTQIRLVVDSAQIYFGGTATPEPACAASLAAPGGSRSETLEIPSGEVKLIHPFALTSNGTTTIELDFDGGQSVNQTGNGRYRMTPVIKILAVKTGL